MERQLQMQKPVLTNCTVKTHVGTARLRTMGKMGTPRPQGVEELTCLKVSGSHSSASHSFLQQTFVEHLLGSLVLKQ